MAPQRQGEARPSAQGRCRRLSPRPSQRVPEDGGCRRSGADLTCPRPTWDAQSPRPTMRRAHRATVGKNRDGKMFKARCFKDFDQCEAGTEEDNTDASPGPQHQPGKWQLSAEDEETSLCYCLQTIEGDLIGRPPRPSWTPSLVPCPHAPPLPSYTAVCFRTEQVRSIKWKCW